MRYSLSLFIKSAAISIITLKVHGFGFGPPTPFTPHCSVIPCDGAGVCAGQAFVNMGTKLSAGFDELNQSYSELGSSLNDIKDELVDARNDVKDAISDQSDRVVEACKSYHMLAHGDWSAHTKQTESLYDLLISERSRIESEYYKKRSLDANTYLYGDSFASNLDSYYFQAQSSLLSLHKIIKRDLVKERIGFAHWISDKDGIATNHRMKWLKRKAVDSLKIDVARLLTTKHIINTGMEKQDVISNIVHYIAPKPSTRTPIDPASTDLSLEENNYVERNLKAALFEKKRRAVLEAAKEAFLRQAYDRMPIVKDDFISNLSNVATDESGYTSKHQLLNHLVYSGSFLNDWLLKIGDSSQPELARDLVVLYAMTSGLEGEFAMWQKLNTELAILESIE